eukprot:280302-Chlamydomonas_euryale.AAC.2
MDAKAPPAQPARGWADMVRWSAAVRGAANPAEFPVAAWTAARLKLKAKSLQPRLEGYAGLCGTRLPHTRGGAGKKAQHSTHSEADASAERCKIQPGLSHAIALLQTNASQGCPTDSLRSCK